MQVPADIEVWVLTHPSKPAITPATLQTLDVPHHVYQNPDWDWPPDHPELTTNRSAKPHVQGYALRQYRAFRGHQEILKLSQAPFTLVFEDDMAVEENTTPEDVERHIAGARRFISSMQYDAVSFHGRAQSPPGSAITLFGREYVELSLITQDKPGQQYFLMPVTQGYNGKYADYVFRWHEGCLAYLVGPAGRDKWQAAGHGSGMPCDLFLVNELRTLVMRNSLFHHDMTHGSIIAASIIQ